MIYIVCLLQIHPFSGKACRNSIVVMDIQPDKGFKSNLMLHSCYKFKFEVNNIHGPHFFGPHSLLMTKLYKRVIEIPNTLHFVF